MNYARHYDLLINRGRQRILNDYKERHHILPVCLGGTDEDNNLVDLTAAEHRLAHLLLVKMYPGNYKLVYAARMMFIENSYRNGRTKSKQYNWIKKQVSLAISFSKIGISQTTESNLKRSKTLKGIPKTIEETRKNSESHLGKIHSDETKIKIGKSNSGKIPWNKGRTKDTDEILRKVSENRKGYIPWNKGRRVKDV